MGLFDFAKKLVDPGGFVFKSDSQKLAEKQYKTEKDIAQLNFEESKAQNEWNRNFQEQQLQYQKDLNALQMEREDTATQRRVADLKAAGLSPTLAAGSAADTGALHAGSVTPVSPAQMGTPSDVKVKEAMFREGLARDRMQLAMTLVGNIADISRTKAETELIKAQTDNVSSMTPVELALKSQLLEFNEQMNPHKIKNAINTIDLQEKEKAIKDFDLVLMSDDHALKAYQMAKTQLESDLIRANIKMADREYILKGLAIDMATMQNERYGLETEEYKMLQGYMHNSLGLPVGAPINGYQGLAMLLGGTAGVLWDHLKSGVGNASDKVGDFVSRQIDKVKSAASKVKSAAYNPDKVVESARNKKRELRKSSNPRKR